MFSLCRGSPDSNKHTLPQVKHDTEKLQINAQISIVRLIATIPKLFVLLLG